MDENADGSKGSTGTGLIISLRITIPLWLEKGCATVKLGGVDSLGESK